MLEITRPDYCHRSGELADRPGQTAGDEPGAQHPGPQGEDHDQEKHALLRSEDFFQPGIRTTDAGFPCPAVDVTVELRQGGLQAFLELLPSHGERCLPPTRVIEAEDARRGGLNLLLNVADPLGQPHLVGSKLSGPALLPVVHYLPCQTKLLFGAGVQAAQVAPYDLALIEHGGLQLRIRPGASHALPQRLQGPTLQEITPDRLGPDQEGGEDHK